MRTYLFLDDVRNPPSEAWKVFRTPVEFLSYLYKNLPEEVVISLDHDLGENIASGYSVACAIEEMICFGEWKPKYIELLCHSQNPIGKKNIQEAFKAIKNYRDYGIRR